MRFHDPTACIGNKETVEFFQNLGSILDDIDIHESADDDFSEKYNMALNRLKYVVRKDEPVEPSFVRKVNGKGIHSTNCGKCSYKLSEPDWKFCPLCGYRIKR